MLLQNSYAFYTHSQSMNKINSAKRAQPLPRVCASESFLEPVTQVARINPRREAHGPIIIVVIEQELFCFALPAPRTMDPFLDGAGDHGTPKFLFGDFLIFIAMN